MPQVTGVCLSMAIIQNLLRILCNSSSSKFNVVLSFQSDSIRGRVRRRLQTSPMRCQSLFSTTNIQAILGPLHFFVTVLPSLPLDEVGRLHYRPVLLHPAPTPGEVHVAQLFHVDFSWQDVHLRIVGVSL